MKKLLPFLFLFILSLNINAQRPSPKELLAQFNLEKVIYKYDKFKDKTEVSLNSMIFGRVEDGLMLSLNSFFDSRIPSKDFPTLLMFVSGSKTKQYKNNRSLIILADDKRIYPTEFRYDSKTSTINEVESMGYLISKTDIQKVATAKKVEMQLKETEFALSSKQMLLIQDFYKKLVP